MQDDSDIPWLEPKFRAERGIKSERYYKKLNAQLVTKKALKAGILQPFPCIQCGATKTEPHHSSYEPDMQLAVIWLCRSCHEQIHIQHRMEIENAEGT